MFEKALILGLYSITPVHAGSGAELSVIDLPIQRERHTQFPVIWGQSLKGVLRREFEAKAGKEETEVIFGPDTDRASEHAGAISVGDAKILLFPVRSLKGVFAYVTCPLVLERFKRDLELAGETVDFTVEADIDEDKVLAGEDIIVDSNGKRRVILEDVVLTPINSIDSNVVRYISKIAHIQENKLKKKMAIVSNDIFRSFVEMCTEIVARVRIDPKTGTVASGALWYEEFVPNDALFYSVIAIGNAKKGDMSAEDIKDELSRVFGDTFLQIGGDETIGKGFVRIKTLEVKRNENAGAEKG